MVYYSHYMLRMLITMITVVTMSAFYNVTMSGTNNGAMSTGCNGILSAGCSCNYFLQPAQYGVVRVL